MPITRIFRLTAFLPRGLDSWSMVRAELPSASEAEQWHARLTGLGYRVRIFRSHRIDFPGGHAELIEKDPRD